ncbi:MAG: XTP/dITP diphosphatase [Gammaproteobacteria bacterium]
MNHTIVLATSNAGKVQEIQTQLKELPITLRAQCDYAIHPVDETGLTFVENALLKARHACQYSQLPVIADDSGLTVDALDGAPGIYSARFAGKNANDITNNQKLLSTLAAMPTAPRNAQFHCVIVYLRHIQDPAPIICHGQWHGMILHEPRGNSGFGYDPLFYVPSMQCSAAELTIEQKNRLSHRGQAVQQLIQHLRYEFT